MVKRIFLAADNILVRSAYGRKTGMRCFRNFKNPLNGYIGRKQGIEFKTKFIRKHRQMRNIKMGKALYGMHACIRATLSDNFNGFP